MAESHGVRAVGVSGSPSPVSKSRVLHARLEHRAGAAGTRDSRRAVRRPSTLLETVGHDAPVGVAADPVIHGVARRCYLTIARFPAHRISGEWQHAQASMAYRIISLEVVAPQCSARTGRPLTSRS